MRYLLKSSTHNLSATEEEVRLFLSPPMYRSGWIQGVCCAGTLNILDINGKRAVCSIVIGRTPAQLGADTALKFGLPKGTEQTLFVVGFISGYRSARLSRFQQVWVRRRATLRVDRLSLVVAITEHVIPLAGLVAVLLIFHRVLHFMHMHAKQYLLPSLT